MPLTARSKCSREHQEARRVNIMPRLQPLVGLVALICFLPLRATGADISHIAPMLKQGGYVLVLRHGTTDDSQKDVYPFVFDDMKKQRQLSDQGRKVARDMGAAIQTLGIPIGQIYSSKLNRAIETGSLMSGARPNPVNELTDSWAGCASAMDNANGSNEKIGNAIRALVNEAPAIGTKNLLVPHKTNIADAFGKE